MASIALLTMDSLAGYVADDHLALPLLSDLGWDVASVSWRAEERWERHAGVVIRSPWDYQHDVSGFLAALAAIERSGTPLANPLALVHWNVRKSYLLDLAARGCPLPRTVVSESLTAAELDAFVRDAGDGGAVVKPLIGAGGVGTHHVRAAESSAWAAALAELSGRPVLLQTFLPRIRTEGEHSLVYFAGAFSHAVRKIPTGGEFRVQEERGGEILPGGEPARDLLDVAGSVLHAAGGAHRLPLGAPLYARVDLVRDDRGVPTLMELEVIEPSLYLRTDPGAPARFAAAVDAWARLSAAESRLIFRLPMSQTVEISHLGSHVGTEVVILGWVDSTRAHGKVAFLDVRDGTGVVQGVVVKKEVAPEVWDRHAALTQETSVQVTGNVRAEPRAPGGYELSVTGLEILGPSVEYPIQPKEHGVDFLLDHRHLWLRSRMQWAGIRVRSEVEQAIHDFFYQRDFVRLDSPILTGAIGEHAGSLFETDYFGEKAFLAQTGQLYGEAGAAAFRKIYTFGPTFRAEKSKTRRHLTEFWMVEPEVAFMDSAGNMKLQEEFISYLVERALNRCQEELKILERDTSKLANVRPPFHRLDYTDAIAQLKAKGVEIEWGSDLGAPDEVALTEGLDRPLFVYNYPKQAKAFYMKENPADPRTVLCDDCLAPEGYGEIIGGSQREEDIEKLLAGIRAHKLPEASYDWYLDLRRFGTFPHAGFGLGVERTVAWITGRPHIRELIPFPRMMTRLRP